MSEIVYVTVETSPAGDSVVGVFSSIEKARETIHRIVRGTEGTRLQDYRIELHVLDEPPDSCRPWLVAISRDGGWCEVSRFIGCSGCDNDRLMAEASYIEPGGERMRVATWALTPGQALVLADGLRRRLIEDGVWGTRHVSLAPLYPPEPQRAGSGVRPC